jgi:hypothetical protein
MRQVVEDIVSLDAIGIVAGIDKASLRGEYLSSWDYLRHYEEFFKEFRTADINVIEMGVHEGASLRMWKRYFDRAKLIGVDLNPASAKATEDRIDVRVGSQVDEPFMKAIAQEFPPTIVIDDGSHAALHIIQSFNILFPLLAPGGVYVIEDLALHFGGDEQQVEPILYPHNLPSKTVYGFIDPLIRAKMGHVDLAARSAEIDEIRVVGGMVLIRKRRGRKHEDTLVALEREIDKLEAERSTHYAYACFKLAEYLMTYQLDDERALRSAQRGAQTAPDDVYGLQIRRLIFLRLGRVEEAANAANELSQRGAPVDLPACMRHPYMSYPHR